MPGSTEPPESSKFSDAKFSRGYRISSRCCQLLLFHQALFLLLQCLRDLFPWMIKKRLPKKKFIAGLGWETEMNSVLCSAVNPYLWHRGLTLCTSWGLLVPSQKHYSGSWAAGKLESKFSNLLCSTTFIFWSGSWCRFVNLPPSSASLSAADLHSEPEQYENNDDTNSDLHQNLSSCFQRTKHLIPSLFNIIQSP